MQVLTIEVWWGIGCMSCAKWVNLNHNDSSLANKLVLWRICCLQTLPSHPPYLCDRTVQHSEDGDNRQNCCDSKCHASWWCVTWEYKTNPRQDDHNHRWCIYMIDEITVDSFKNKCCRYPCPVGWEKRIQNQDNSWTAKNNLDNSTPKT